MRWLVIAIGLLGCERAPTDPDPTPTPGPKRLALDAAPVPVDASTVQVPDPVYELDTIAEPARIRLVRVQQNGVRLQVRFSATTEADGMAFFKLLAKDPWFADVVPASGERVGDWWDYTVDLKMPKADPKATLDWNSGGGM